jgi:hypothetical protein
VSTLAQAGITTIVVGFGADANKGSAANTLNQMAQNGGFTRTCLTNADCSAGDPNDTCQGATPPNTTGACSRKYFSATNQTQLAAALAKVAGTIGEKKDCALTLNPVPKDPALLAVLVNGVDVPAGPDTWSYASGQIVFASNGAICKDLQDVNRTVPIQVDVRELNVL